MPGIEISGVFYLKLQIYINFIKNVILLNVTK